MSWIFIALKIAIIVFIIKVIMIQAYNILFFIMKKPYLYIIFAGMFNIVALEILSLFFNIKTEAYIFNIYGLSSIIALFFLVPPKTDKVISKKEMNKLSDEMTGIKHSRLLYRVGLFVFFIGNIVGSYLIMYQNGIKIIETVSTKTG